MSNCCGAGRAALAARTAPTAKGTAQTASSPPAGPSVRVRLDRPLDLTLRGSVTGRDYHFTPTARSVQVAAADVDQLMRYAGLVREP
jgi:hypothetical protein